MRSKMIEETLHKGLRKAITRGRLQVTYPSGRCESYGDGVAQAIAIRITDPAALRAIAFDPQLAAAEAYMDGRLVLEAGDIFELISLAKMNGSTDRLSFLAWLQHLRRSIRGPVNRAIGLGEARRNIAHHYDLDERLYRLFLDEDMQYSCAWFEHPDISLDAAQLAKKRLIAAKMLLRPGARVLDIGSGWGGMALYLAEVCGADVTGITLSAEQHRAATARAAERGLEGQVRFLLEDYRETAGQFDAIVSVGMFEHVGRRQFPAFFQTVARLLAPDGVMLLHSMAQRRPYRYNQPFMEKYIFPGGYIPALSEVLPAAEGAGLLMRDIEILTLHYARTTRAWRERFLARRDAVLALYDERFIRMWEFYLAGCEASFRQDAMHVFHLQLVKDQARVPLTRAYLAEAMSNLAAIEAGVPSYAHLHAATRDRTAAEGDGHQRAL